jgi:hypothetical protein
MDFDTFFEDGDDMLDGGGQVVADGVSLIPEIGAASEAAQSIYHSGHAMNDFKNGNYTGAAKEELEALWHGVGAVPEFHDALQVPHMIETAWDTAQLLGGNNVPIVPKRSLGAAAMNAVGHYAD